MNTIGQYRVHKMVDMALRETIHILAQHSPLCKDIEEAREKLIMLGLTEKEADALIERQYVIGYDIAENEDLAINAYWE